MAGRVQFQFGIVSLLMAVALLAATGALYAQREAVEQLESKHRRACDEYKRQLQIVESLLPQNSREMARLKPGILVKEPVPGALTLECMEPDWDFTLAVHQWNGYEMQLGELSLPLHTTTYTQRIHSADILIVHREPESVWLESRFEPGRRMDCFPSGRRCTVERRLECRAHFTGAPIELLRFFDRPEGSSAVRIFSLVLTGEAPEPEPQDDADHRILPVPLIP